MAKLLLLYSTTDGHTVDICQKIQDINTALGHDVTLCALAEITESSVDLSHYDKIIIGASIRYGKHNKIVAQFINQNHQLLSAIPAAFFSVNVVARKINKNTAETNPYLVKFLDTITWQPTLLAVFAGKIDYSKYGLLDRWMIQLIMRLTKGPTDAKSVTDFTDWQQVESFGQAIARM